MSSKALSIGKSDHTRWSEFTSEEQRCERRITALCLTGGLLILAGTVVGTYLCSTQLDNTWGDATVFSSIVFGCGTLLGGTILGSGVLRKCFRPNPNPRDLSVQTALKVLFQPYNTTIGGLCAGLRRYPLTWMVHHQILTPEQGDEVKAIRATHRALTSRQASLGWPHGDQRIASSKKVQLDQLDERWSELNFRIFSSLATDTDHQALGLYLRAQLKNSSLQRLRLFGFRGMVDKGYLTQQEADAYQQLLNAYFVTSTALVAASIYPNSEGTKQLQAEMKQLETRLKTIQQGSQPPPYTEVPA